MVRGRRDNEPATPELLEQLRGELQHTLAQAETRPLRRHLRIQRELLAQIDRVSAELATIALKGGDGGE